MGSIFVFKALSEKWFSIFLDFIRIDTEESMKSFLRCAFGQVSSSLQTKLHGISQPRAWRLLKGPITFPGLRCELPLHQEPAGDVNNFRSLNNPLTSDH